MTIRRETSEVRRRKPRSQAIQILIGRCTKGGEK
ncbi:MAG: hypothetical protein MRERC_3c065 [Mycoplasmataceae bacterium RC_NB112A]|nr:MAG: hypothetical protein MRERC_3c065 [Mycoplasmataceae bacterium RC_NB112A]